MKVIHIENSYNTWTPSSMRYDMYRFCYDNNIDEMPITYLNRSYKGMYIEWWLHNIGYWITLPFVKLHPAIATINSRCKDVDLEEHK